MTENEPAPAENDPSPPEDRSEPTNDQRQEDVISLPGEQAFFSGKTIVFSLPPAPEQGKESSSFSFVNPAAVGTDTVGTDTVGTDAVGTDAVRTNTAEVPEKDAVRSVPKNESPRFSLSSGLPDLSDRFGPESASHRNESSGEDDQPLGNELPTIAFPREELPAASSPEEPKENSSPSGEGSFFFDFFSSSVPAKEKEDENAFVAGMQSVFHTDESEDDNTTEPVGPYSLSETEVFQQEEAERQRENLDGIIRQNNADSLFELGEKYDRPGEEERIEPTRSVEINPVSLLEAMLFVGDRENQPLSLEKATSLMRNVSVEEALEAIQTLNARFLRNGAPYEIVQDGPGWRFALRPEYEPVRERFFGKTREFKLQQKAIDVLSLVAYRQPVSAAEIQEVRPGTASVLSQLVKRDLIVAEKKTVDKKQVVYYRTTPRFLTLFNLESLDDLPIVDEIDFR